MRLSQAFVVLALVIGLAFAAHPTQNAKAVAGSFVTDEILVKFKPGTGASAQADAHRRAGGTPLAEIALTSVQLVGVPAGSEMATIARYQSNPNVLYAEPNFIRAIPEPVSHAAGSEVVANDYYFDEEWGLNNTGQMFECLPWISGELCFYIGTPDADIDAPEGWAISMGSPSVIVAVLDTGIDYTHPDLAANYIGGDDFIFNDGDPMDDQGHGTHVSGTIAAALNNPTGSPAREEGVVGVAPNASLLVYKVCDSNGQCNDFAIERAITAAAAAGADVINMSWGSADNSQSLNDALQVAWNAGVVLVAGAGNDSSTALFYPAAFENVIAVGAYDEDDQRASFSNYGSWVEVSAPGNVVMSTYPMWSCGGASSTPGDTGCYTWLSGTSMATPHVSGAAALVWSRADVTTNTQVRDILLRSADGAGVAARRLDSWTQYGGVNLHGALSIAVSGITPTPTATATATPTATATATAQPPPTATPAPSDVVVITKAIYNSRQGQLTVEATCSGICTTLTVYDNSSPAEPAAIGTLLFNSKKGKYVGAFPWPVKPAEVLVTSDGGGSDTSRVGGR